jgi:formaldehyde-activating enzyme involved in methanogenesis
VAHIFEDALLREALVGEEPEMAHIDLVIGCKAAAWSQAL